MRRRDLFSTILISGAAARSSWADTSNPRFPGTPFRQYSRCLPDYLRYLAKQAAGKRDAQLARLTSPSAIAARQKWVRDTLWKLIGGMPERTPLNPRTTGSLARTGYHVDKVVYESRPGSFISANLYVPEGAGPFPAVLFQCGHYEEGKAYPTYQKCCQGLTRLGFVVLAFDPMGQGERVAYPNSSGVRSRLQDVDMEHTIPGKQMLLYGDSATRYQLWDAMRSLDYLLSLPVVDPKRVATTGHSGGGTLTMLLSGADERLAAAAPCMGNIENLAAQPFLPPGSTDDAEQDFANAGPLGFDRWDLLYPLAPKPLLIWPSDRDYYATYSSQYVANGWTEFQKLKAVYTGLHHPERLAWADTPLPHSLAEDSRLLIYNWFRRWLQEESKPLQEEPAVAPEKESDLWATKAGSVVLSLKSLTPFASNRARQLARSPMPLDALLSISRPVPASGKLIAHTKSGKVQVEVLEVSSDPGVWMPAWVLTPQNTPAGKPVLLVLDPAQAEALWFKPDADSVLTPDGPIVCAADIRGVGALAPEFSPGSYGYAAGHRLEEDYAWGSLWLGKTLLAQRVTDILALAAALRNHSATAGRPVRIAASQRLAIPALFAAALDPKIEALYLDGALISFQDIVDTENYHHTFADFIPGFLLHTDLPDIAASINPRKVILAGPVNAHGDTTADAARKAYAAAANVSVEQKLAWSAERLLAFATT